MHKRSLRTFGWPLLAGFLMASGCGDDSGGSGGKRSLDASVGTVDGSLGVPGPGSGLNDGGGTSLTDNQIAGAVAAANQGEIDQGQLASGKAQAKGIVDYAKLMVAMHTEAQQAQTALLQTAGLAVAPSAVSVMLTGNASAQLAKLTSEAAGPAFDFDYITAQARQHQVVLDLLDQTLLPQADDAALKTALDGARAMVKQHLDTANTLVATFQVGPDGGVIGVGLDGGALP